MIHSIKINEDEKVIKFIRSFQKKECSHDRVTISVDDNEILCNDCNSKVNAIWWIAKHLKHLNDATRRNNEVLSEYRTIWKKLDDKRNFMCKKCHEVNEIDFHKMLSKAAVMLSFLSKCSPEYPPARLSRCARPW